MIDTTTQPSLKGDMENIPLVTNNGLLSYGLEVVLVCDGDFWIGEVNFCCDERERGNYHVMRPGGSGNCLPGFNFERERNVRNTHKSQAR